MSKDEIYDELKLSFHVSDIGYSITPSRARNTDIADIYPTELLAVMSNEVKHPPAKQVAL